MVSAPRALAVPGVSFLKLSTVLLLHLVGQLRIAARAAPDRPFHEIDFPPEVGEAHRAGGRVDRHREGDDAGYAVRRERRPVLGE